MNEILSEFEKTIGHKFKNPGLLADALCHKSYINESKVKINSYERLEFLGDSVLGVIVSRYIYDNYPKLPEGELTKLRASVVCEATLSDAARRLDAGRYILLSRGEAMSGGSDKDAILCDVFESVVAAVFLDSGMEQARTFVLDNLSAIIDNHAANIDDVSDYKTTLQETVQQTGGSVDYRLNSESGPDHQKRYCFGVYVNDKCIAEGTGASKKKAQQNAAKQAISKM